MKTMLLALALLVTAPFAYADQNTTGDSFKLIHTADLAPLIRQGAPAVYVFDANNNDTRKKEGIIPGATPLTSHDKYALSVLPKDRDAKLVFYCANEECTASHAAASRAVGAGYSDVSVLSDGIMGWKENGQKAAKFKPKKPLKG